MNHPSDVEFTDLLLQLLTKMSHLIIKQQIIVNHLHKELSCVLDHLNLCPKRINKIPDDLQLLKNSN